MPLQTSAQHGPPVCQCPTRTKICTHPETREHLETCLGGHILISTLHVPSSLSCCFFLPTAPHPMRPSENQFSTHELTDPQVSTAQPDEFASVVQLGVTDHCRIWWQTCKSKSRFHKGPNTEPVPLHVGRAWPVQLLLFRSWQPWHARSHSRIPYSKKLLFQGENHLMGWDHCV